MTAFLRVPLVAAAVVFGASLMPAQEMADNPFYKFWGKSKVGDSVTLKETTKLTGPAAGGETGGDEVKVIVHKLVSFTPEKAVVSTVVTEGEVFGFVETAPTKHIYPAKMSKDVLEELIQETGAKAVDATVKVGGKEHKVKYLTGTIKGKGGDEVEFKVWLSDEVPGSIAKRIRTTRVKGEVVAETTIELVKYGKKGE
ncbi:hypothetical protein [Urbifossiella limnaea]|uniref:Uncharacterized protein n=1 Tax=Urbifossiella limnaea TaxID=2528023 RepID=A0A517XXM6_9BACT|nr:hypothetical protein [Urbifossiella limnaea]QDU22266.1 hypothetical protein ETAA1_42430 [Urbifossiella limnaea]